MIKPPSKRRASAPRPRRRLIDGQARRGGGLRRLPDLLNRVLDPAARRRGLAEAKLLTEWPTIVGPWLAARSQPVRLSQRGDRAGGVLTLHVGGTAALELQHGQPQILERINGFFGYPAVARLHLIQAPLQRARERLSPIRSRSLTSAEENEVAVAVREVGDPALKEALAGLGRTLKGRRGEIEARPTRPRLAG